MMKKREGKIYGLKYVKGNKKKNSDGIKKVKELGVMDDVGRGYKMMMKEMKILKEMRKDENYEVEEKNIEKKNERKMEIIGNGEKREFKEMELKEIMGVEKLRIYEIEKKENEK